MKKSVTLCVAGLAIALLSSCDLFEDLNNNSLGGESSPMAEVGVTVGTSSVAIAGVSNFQGRIITSKDNVATYSATATVTNTAIKNLFANIPGVTFSGNQLTVSNVQFKQTTDGIEFKTGPTAGVLVKYSSSVGDTYPVGDTGSKRKVVSKSTTDDYPYGFYNIKVMEVEEPASALMASSGIAKITYYANHKFGLVGFKLTFDDGSVAKFPVYTSAQNN